MKKLYLVCGAHIDPVWLWNWQEGAAAAISTFRVAAQLCREFDGFVFCHNEAVLYQWVEEYEPALFAQIQQLVREGKWHIMGGWYLQPDCIHPSGESFIRQIRVGRRYFQEKFGVTPTTALNFDSFGHSRGLVQILKKCGYDSYLFMRPLERQSGAFLWEGFDGSRIMGYHLHGSYGNLLGEATEKVRHFLDHTQETEDALLVWGVGDHGGGPSRLDLTELAQLQKTQDTEIVHSTPEEYFAQVSWDNRPVVTTSLTHCMQGCYTTMIRIKQAHRRLEALLGRAEKMLAHSGVTYDKGLLEQAEKALLFHEFHDILPGTMIRQGEEDALAALGFAEDVVAKATAKAFFALCQGQRQAAEGEIPILVYNPHPYSIETTVEAEYQLANQNWAENQATIATVYDEAGNRIPCQHEKEACSMNLDWRKRLAFHAKLAPMSMNRFDARLEVQENCHRDEVFALETATHTETDNQIVFDNGTVQFALSRETGLITRYCVDGCELLRPGAGQIGVFADNEDPWGMLTDHYTEKLGHFRLLSDEEAAQFRGYPDSRNIQVIENGPVRMRIQAIYAWGRSYVVANYTLYYHKTYVDLDYTFLTADTCKMFKLQLPTCFPDSRLLCQTAFGTEENIQDHKEIPFQKWCALEHNGNGLGVLSRGTGGGDADAGLLRLSLLRTPVYSAHPINERPLVPHDRLNDHIDLGQRQISLRMAPYSDTLDALAEQFNEPVFALSFFPAGDGEKPAPICALSDEHVLLSALRREDEGLLVRLYHAGTGERDVQLTLWGHNFPLHFGSFEVKTLRYAHGALRETDMLGTEKLS